MGIGKQNFKSNSHEWATPDAIWLPLNQEFRFSLDVCATPENARCEHYYTKEQDGLKQPWTGTCWMNPPFGHEMRKWVKRAWEASQQEGATVVMLLPSRTNTNWWHDYVMKGEVRFIRGCPKFGNAKRGLWMPLAIVVFRGNGKPHIGRTQRRDSAAAEPEQHQPTATAESRSLK